MASFGLVVLHAALPADPLKPLSGEGWYLLGLTGFFLESLWEAGHSLKRTGRAFAIPSHGWIRANLLLAILLIAFIVAFQGVDQERFSTLYIFPVLASAFYLSIPEIVGVGALSALAHIVTVLLFHLGQLPIFGHSTSERGMGFSEVAFILGFAMLQIAAATLVVVLIRKHLETLREDLSQSEATVDVLSSLYQQVFESMFSGIITTDLKGRITSANPAASHILNRPLTPGTQLDHLEGLDLMSPYRQEGEKRFELSFVTEGQPHLIGGHLAPLLDRQGHQTGHLLLFKDLTEIKALEDRTRLSERLAAVGELSAELAHELRNPLASILGCVQILGEKPPSPAMMERLLGILRRESERVGALVSGFLDFSKPRPMTLEPIWLPTLLEEARASFEIDARNEGLTLDMEPAPSLWVHGDAVSVHQVFGNLFSNGRKALKGSPEPRLSVRFQRQGEHLICDVEDNGCGMSSEQLRTLFVPFASGFVEGTGLGMSLVFQLVQRMGWDIAPESQKGLGTRIRLKMPVVDSPETKT
ncbi:MAG: ATP-binding protein [Firmicutes bacterium]|nr:ATP-binding protein [Bacillota bacterium]